MVSKSRQPVRLFAFGTGWGVPFPTAAPFPLKLATWMGYAASLLAFLYLASVFVQKLLGYTVEGWATIMVALLFLGGTQLICLGIIGEYVGRIFQQVKHRPLFVVEERLGVDPPGPPGSSAGGPAE